MFTNEEEAEKEEYEYVLEQIPGTNKFSLKKTFGKAKDLFGKIKKGYDIKKFRNLLKNAEAEEEDAELEVSYELVQIPGTNKFSLKKIFKKAGKIIKTVTKVVKVATKVYGALHGVPNNNSASNTMKGPANPFTLPSKERELISENVKDLAPNIVLSDLVV